MAKKERKLERPSEDEIGKLPHWAQVGFAARCDCRIQPLFMARGPGETPPEHVEAVGRAINAAETSASRAAVSVSSSAVQAAAVACRRAD